MISIRVTNQKQNHQFEHSSGSIEFGRGMAKGKCERFVLNDLFASRDQLRVEELPDGRLRAENLSGKQEVTLGDGTSIPVGGCREVAMPIRMVVGQTYLDFQPV